MATLPLPEPQAEPAAGPLAASSLQPAASSLPDYLPARMVNEFVYCPRLFFYEWVEGLFRQSADTVEGKVQHGRVDRGSGALPPAEELKEEEKIHSRSVMLSSDAYRLIAKMDLLEVEDGAVTPVDYKHGKPRETDAGIELWPTDRVQLAVQALVLRDNGYRCEEGVVYYAKTRQRARVVFDAALIAETLRAVEQAWATAAAGDVPPPLADSPKCPACSLAPICLPDETSALGRLEAGGWSAEEGRRGDQLELFEPAGPLPPRKPPAEARRLVAARDDLRPLYLNTQGLRVGRSGAVLQVREKDQLVQEVRLGEVCQLDLMGNIQLTTQTIQTLCEADIPVCYFSQGGWFYGITTGLNTKNVFLRRAQFQMAEQDWFCLGLSRRLVAGKVRNQRTMLLRNHEQPDEQVLREMKQMAERAEQAASLEELLGIEGNAARLYFSQFGGMLKAEPDSTLPAMFRFDFQTRNRRPPRDAVNALLSLGYSLLVKDLTIACYAVGFDPLMGFYHQPRFGRPALALDLMEPFRPLVADSAAISAINTRMVAPRDFIAAGNAVSLNANGRKAFFRAFELRMDTMVTHPLFEYRVSYRRLLEIQARLLAKVLQGEIGEYPVFVTR
jgi:CRISPR-associated protein Cas1